MARDKASQVLVPVEQAGQPDARAVMVYRNVAAILADPVSVAPPGYALRFQWAAVAGATGVEVEPTHVQVSAAVVSESLGELPIAAGTRQVDITIPDSKRIARLQLEGLQKKNDDDTWTDLRGAADLGQDGPRLVVSTQGPGGDWLPLYTVPEVSQRGILPPMFGGASFDNRVLTLPAEAAAPRLRLQVVNERHPENFEPLILRVTRVVGWADVPPCDLELAGPDGNPAWAYPGEMPPDSPAVDVDLRLPLEAALGAVLSQGAPLDVTFRLQAGAAGMAYVTGGSGHGAVVRAFPGVWSSRLEGDPVRLDLGSGLKGIALAAEQPSSVTADLTVRYDGVRVLEGVSAAVPGSAGGVQGRVLTAEPVVVDLPPAAFTTLPVVRVGLVGRAPEPCELSVKLVDLSAGRPGTPLGAPGVVKVAPSSEIGTVWIDVPAGPPPGAAGPTGLSAQANQGRFFWVSGEAPLIRVAVRDPDPGGRPLRLGGQTIAAVGGDVHQPGLSLAPAAFVASPPWLESDLFLSVDLSDIELRYGR